MMSNNHAIDNAKGWLEIIRELVLKLNNDGLTDEQREEARDEILQGPLSVMVRDDWRQPGDSTPRNEAVEYEILLSTGGPALRIYGALGQYNEPEDYPRLQWQDWGTPWTDYPLSAEDADAVTSYARCFYYREG